MAKFVNLEQQGKTNEEGSTKTKQVMGANYTIGRSTYSSDFCDTLLIFI